MKLADLRLCGQCEEVFDRLRSLICGLKEFDICPACGSRSTVLISTYIPTMAEFEKVEKRTESIPVGAVCNG